MKQEETDQVKLIIGTPEYNEKFGFISNVQNSSSMPFAYAYENKLYDRKLIGKFIVDAINDKLAPPKINLNEVEKVVWDLAIHRALNKIRPNILKTDNKLNETMNCATDFANELRSKIGYQLTDLKQAEGGEG